MADPTDDTVPPAPPETPLQRALRLKKAAHQAHAKAKANSAGQRRLERAAAAQSSAKSKPWMSR